VGKVGWVSFVAVPASAAAENRITRACTFCVCALVFGAARVTGYHLACRPTAMLNTMVKLHAVLVILVSICAAGPVPLDNVASLTTMVCSRTAVVGVLNNEIVHFVVKNHESVNYSSRT
jgi:hypothetical protein